MNSERELYELLDGYAKGTLSPASAAAFEQQLKNDPALREKLAQHLAVIQALKFHDERKKLRDTLNQAHAELDNTKVIPLTQPSATKAWRRYGPLTAVAASVALISVVGTLFYTRNLDTKQSAQYRELRRNVDQIKKSQKIMMEDIAEAKDSQKPVPGNYAGTGFMISKNGYIATSYHVIKESDSVVIENVAFGRIKAKVILSNPAHDISILKIDPLESMMDMTLPYTLSKTEASLAEDVYTLGYPREDVVFGEGSISALTGFRQNPDAYQVSVPVNPGNSGGPLLNTKGDLVGVISGIQTETLGAAFAIKSTVLMDVITSAGLDTLAVPLVLPKQNALKSSNRVQQVKRWKDFVFMVAVYKNN